MAKNKSTDNASNANGFESSLASLEKLINRMEQGELSLEESLKAFEEGIKLTREAQNSLAKAEQTIQLLLGDSEEPKVRPFSEEDGDGE